MAYNQPYYNGGYFPQYQNGAVPDILNQYKGQYQQQIMQQPMVQQMQTPTQTNDMIWVLNENEATSYPVAPNNSVVLWDKNAPKTHECTCGDKYATKEQLNAVEGKINDILAMYEELKDKQTQKTIKPTKKEVE